MLPGMHEGPDVVLSEHEKNLFRHALEQRDPALLPTQLPRWVFLQWLAGQGYLLHGSANGGIQCFEPRTPVDLSPDEFSKRTAVFAASDGLWALMYALVDWKRAKRLLNMALQRREQDGWSPMHYFLSLAPREEGVTEARDLLRDGLVYVLPGTGFEAMASYAWPEVGEVREPQWVNVHPVVPVMCVPVTPEDYPLTVRMHDAERVDRLAQSDPWNFPWLEDG